MPCGSELLGELLRQADEGVLGRRVGLDAGETRAQAGAGGDRDDAAVALALHDRRDVLRHQEGARRVDVHDGVPVVLRHVFDGRPTWPRTPPAQWTRTSMRPASAAIARDEGANGGLVGDVERRDVRAGLLRERRKRAGRRRRVAKTRRRPQRAHDGAADALRRARDEGDLSGKARAHGASISSRVDQASGRRPSSMSWISATSRSSAGVGTPAAWPIVATMPICASTSVLRLRTARSRQMPEWLFAEPRLKATMASIEAASAAVVRAGTEGAGIEAVEAAGRHALRGGDRHHFAAERAPDRAMARRGEGVGDRLVRERGAEQQRAIAELAPEIRPDVRRQHGVGLELLQQRVHLARAIADRAVDLADDDRGAVAAQDPAGREVVGAEIDEAAHHPRLAERCGRGRSR